MDNKKIILYSFISLLFISCNGGKIKEDNNDQISVKGIFNGWESETQKYTFRSDSLIKITGTQGTIIEILPNSLEDESCKSPTGDIVVQLNEYYTPSSMIYRNLTTQTENNLLETGGMIDLKVTSDGKPLRLKKGKSYKVGFPMQTKPKVGMHLYNSSESDGVVYWNDLPNEKYGNAIGVDTIFDETGAKVPFYQKELTNYLFNTNTDFGLINCDREFEGENKTLLTMKIDTLILPQCLIVFPESRMIATYKKEGSDFNFYNIPKGEKAILLSYYQKGEKYFLYKEEIVVAEKITIIPKYINLEKSQMKKMIDEINWLSITMPWGTQGNVMATRPRTC